VSFPGKKTLWHGFDRYAFPHGGRNCLAITPKQAAEGTPWIWRARFFGHEPQTDIALLKKGWHVVYCDVGNLYGAPAAVAHWDAFYKMLTEKHGFAKKAVLEGMSRGGLIIFNWAAANPDKVACIYADAPACDFKSWPGGKGKGKGAPSCWNACIKVYGFKDEAEALAMAGIERPEEEPTLIEQSTAVRWDDYEGYGRLTINPLTKLVSVGRVPVGGGERPAEGEAAAEEHVELDTK